LKVTNVLSEEKFDQQLRKIIAQHGLTGEPRNAHDLPSINEPVAQLGKKLFFSKASGEMALIPFVNLGTGRTATDIAAGGYHNCALMDNASVKCWELGSQGQLGNDSFDAVGNSAGEMASLTSINLGIGRTATAIDTGQMHSCALLDNASVKCWGYNNHGQLGIDNNTSMGRSSGSMDQLIGIDF